MTKDQPGYCILGVNQRGDRFRPSDWVERVAGVFAQFDASQRLCYSKQVRPATFDGVRCLFVASSLATIDPAGYDFVMDFANDNQLVVHQVGQVANTLTPAIELPDVA